MMDAVSSCTDGHQDPMPPAIPQERDSTGFNKVCSNKTQLLKEEENRSGKIDTLKEVLRNLECQAEEIRNQRITILRKLHQLDGYGEVLKGKTIAFVEAIERANQYIDFKKYLEKEGLISHDSDELEVFKQLIKKEEVQATYDKLRFQDIKDAVDDHIWSLQIERDRKEIQSEQVANTNSPYPEGQTRRFTLSELAKTSRRRIEDPVIDLVFYLRAKEYVLDQNPQVEIDRIRKHNSIYYTHNLQARLRFKYSEKKVMVSSIPLDYDENKVKASFSSCGVIDDFEMIHGGWRNMAYVTFRDAEGAKLAPILKDEKFIVMPILESKECARAELAKECDKAMSMYSCFRRSALQIRRCRRRERQGNGHAQLHQEEII